MVEVVLLGTLLLVPIVYVLLVVLRLQAAELAVAQAARDVARVMDGAPTVEVGLARAHEIVAIGLRDQGLPADEVDVFFVPGGDDCSGPATRPQWLAGSVWTVCVRTVVTLPGIPTVLSGSRNTVTGVHVTQVGELRES